MDHLARPILPGHPAAKMSAGRNAIVELVAERHRRKCSEFATGVGQALNTTDYGYVVPVLHREADPCFVELTGDDVLYPEAALARARFTVVKG